MKRLPVLALLLLTAAPLPAAADEYDPQKAGHPLRIVAYIAHPAGVILDYLVFRPAWWLGSFEPIRTLVGREPAPPEQPVLPAPEPDTEPSGSDAPDAR